MTIVLQCSPGGFRVGVARFPPYHTVITGVEGVGRVELFFLPQREGVKPVQRIPGSGF